MKTPIDATGHAGAVLALLNSGADFVYCDLWAIALNGGTVIRWHGAGFEKQSIVFATANANAAGTYLAGPVIERGRISTKLGTEVATMTGTFFAGPADLINGVPLLPFVRGNGFDGATATVYRAYFTAWGQPLLGATIKFSGRVTSLKNVTRTSFEMTLSSWLVLLNVNMGPDVYQAGCLNTHYDTNCGLVKSSYQFSGTVSTGATTLALHSSLSNADGYFTKGQITFTSGANAGLSRSVQSYLSTAGAFTVAFPLPFAPANGDTFTAWRGCMLTQADCIAQSNIGRFRGQPFTPPAITGAVTG